MNIGSWLKDKTEILENASIGTARLDVEVLLSDALSKDRSWIHAHQDFKLDEDLIASLDKLLQRRSNHEPLAYIRGKQEFYGREFEVSPATLTPRPETETMIEMLLIAVDKKQLNINSSTSIIDVGTGSGCIILTVTLELAKKTKLKLENSDLIGVDISEEALAFAKENSDRLSVDVSFRLQDITKDNLFDHIDAGNDVIILANLPYVPEDFHINLAASHEPPESIYGGKDGLKYYRKLFSQLKTAINEGRICKTDVFTECLPPQHEKLNEIASVSGYKLVQTQDLIQHYRSY